MTRQPTPANLVWQMLEHARHSSMTEEEAVAQAARYLQRTYAYLQRRRYRNGTDEAMEADMEAIAKLIVLVQAKGETTNDPAPAEH